MIQNQFLINGRWISASQEQTFAVKNPATGETISVVPYASGEDVEQAINAANDAFPSWSSTTAYHRAALMRKAADIVEEHQDEIAQLLTMEQGKPVREALGEVAKGIEIIRFYAVEAERVFGKIIPSTNGIGSESHVLYQPVGPVGAISPWNYPIELLAWKLGGALGAGCTLIAKLPSETPLSPLAFLYYVSLAGFPDGVINALTGPGSIVGPLLCQSPKLRKIAFTGSSAVGKTIMAACAPSLKRISLELGGSLPMIVCKDADWDKAAKDCAYRSFRNMGQICIAINRVYVDRAVYSPFLAKLKTYTQAMVIGNGLSETVDLGPMCTKKGLDTTISHIEDALTRGARLICGGKAPVGAEYKNGFFYEPTVIAEADHSMLIMQEETFGPAIGVMPTDSLDEAISLANCTNYGLAAVIYTKQLDTARKGIIELQAGNVAVNNVNAGVLQAPYGGWKESGIGHEHAMEGLYEYLNIKHVHLTYN